MKEKLYDPAGSNSEAPAKGMAAVDTANSEELDQQTSSPVAAPQDDEAVAESEGMMGE